MIATNKRSIVVTIVVGARWRVHAAVHKLGRLDSLKDAKIPKWSR